MEASSGTTQAARTACGECATPNLAGANFCKACGASIAPPPKCPKCETDVERDAKFCPQCGTKLVGARPAAPKNGHAKAADAPAEKRAKRDALAAEKAKLPPPKKPSSNITTNVVLFAALILGTATLIYAVGKGQKKEMSPFEGGPPPAMTGAPPASPPASSGEEAIPAGEPIKGEIARDPSLGEEGSGTLFIILRNAGMPNQGPPLAVKRIENPTFPVAFEVGPSDVMMKGMPFMGPFDIYVRLDRDGNAMTKDAGDLTNSAPASGITAGATDVRITLDKKL